MEVHHRQSVGPRVGARSTPDVRRPTSNSGRSGGPFQYSAPGGSRRVRHQGTLEQIAHELPLRPLLGHTRVINVRPVALVAAHEPFLRHDLRQLQRRRVAGRGLARKRLVHLAHGAPAASESRARGGCSVRRRWAAGASAWRPVLYEPLRNVNEDLRRSPADDYRPSIAAASRRCASLSGSSSRRRSTYRRAASRSPACRAYVARPAKEVTVVGMPAQSFRQHLHGLLRLPPVVQGHGIRIRIARQLRRQTRGVLERRGCLGPALLPHERKAQRMLQRRRLRRAGESLPQRGLGLALRTTRAVHVREVHVRFGKRGLQLQRLAVLRNGDIQIAACAVQISEVEPRLRPIRVVAMGRDVFGERPTRR